MPMYEVVTPLRNGGSKPVPAGKVVELAQTEGDALVRVGALAPAPADAVPDADAAPRPKPLAKQNKAELLATAKAEGVAIADDATNAVIVAAIEATRAQAGA